MPFSLLLCIFFSPGKESLLRKSHSCIFLFGVSGGREESMQIFSFCYQFCVNFAGLLYSLVQSHPPLHGYCLLLHLHMPCDLPVAEITWQYCLIVEMEAFLYNSVDLHKKDDHSQICSSAQSFYLGGMKKKYWCL